MEQVFTTQRKRLVREYAEAGQEVIANTIPYHSTAQIVFEVVDALDDANGAIAYAVARRNQTLNFFGYGVGDQIQLGAENVRATESETNLAKGTSTNGAEDYVIEGVGLECRAMRLEYDDDLLSIQTSTADADVQAATEGRNAIYDPAGIIAPPQMQSPFNLENGLMQHMLGLCSLEFLFDRKRVEKVGTLVMLPQAGAQSYLRANGEPNARNKYCIPEGYLWRRDGLPDSEFQALVRVDRALVVPINRLIPPPASETVSVSPNRIYLELVMRVYGLSVDLPSAN